MEVWILSCERTGRFWRHSSEAQCRHAARRLGLKDYTWCKEDLA